MDSTRPSDQQPWRIEMFGKLRAVRGSQSITRFRTRKAGELLAYLALHRGRAFARDLLAERLWPDAASDSARHNLRLCLSSLRSQFEGETGGVTSSSTHTVLQADRLTISLNAIAVATDIEEFDAAIHAVRRHPITERAKRQTEWERAIALYTGQFLPDCDEEWALSERTRLEEVFVRSVLDWTEILMDSAPAEALYHCERSLTVAPGRYELHVILVRLLVAAGRPDAARGEYQRLKQYCRREGIDLPEQVRSLFRPHRQEPSASTSRPTASVTAPYTRPPLAGTMTVLLIALPEEYPELRVIIRDAVLEQGGTLLNPVRRIEENNQINALFSRAKDALSVIRMAFQEGDRSRLRVALHTAEVGTVDKGREKTGQDEDALLRVGRALLAAANTGQALCSEVTAVLLRPVLPASTELRRIGRFRLPYGIECLHSLFPSEEKEVPPLAPHAHPNNLPLTLTTFFGRTTELAAVISAVSPESTSRKRLLTLTGPGGSGKTRLALEAAQQLLPAFANAIWFVGLRTVRDSSGIGAALSAALGLAPAVASEITPWQHVAEELLRYPMPLLILDNAEHLINDTTDLGNDLLGLLTRVPTLVCIITSRRSLGIAGEWELPVAPLPLPDEEVMSAPSSDLFVDRARAVRPDFALTDRNREAVAAICHRLEGLPLALEIAAARIATRSPSAILAQLNRRLDLPPVSPNRISDERHQSLRATVAWSYALLSRERQLFFARLCIFRGGWEGEAARIAAPDHWQEEQVLDALNELRRDSLITTEETQIGSGEDTNSGIRFSMLETLREYAEECLDSEEYQAIATQQAGYFLQLLQRIRLRLGEPALLGPKGRVELEHDNIRAALDWAASESGDSAIGLQLATEMSPFWLARGHLVEGSNRLQALLHRDASGLPEHHAPALIAIAYLSRDQGNLEIAEACLHKATSLLYTLPADHPVRYEQEALIYHNRSVIHIDRGEWMAAESQAQKALELWRVRNNSLGIGWAQICLGWTMLGQEKVQAAMEFGQEALAVLTRCQNYWWMGMSYFLLAHVHAMRGDNSARRSHLAQSLELHRLVDSPRPIATCLRDLAIIAIQEQDWPGADRYAQESLVLCRQAGDRWNSAYAVHLLAETATGSQDYTRAHQLYEDALGLFRDLGRPYGISWALQGQAKLACLAGDTARARTLLQDALKLMQETGIETETAIVAAQLAKLPT